MSQQFDDAGRLRTRSSGIGTNTEVTDPFLSNRTTSLYAGYLAPTVKSQGRRPTQDHRPVLRTEPQQLRHARQSEEHFVGGLKLSADVQRGWRPYHVSLPASAQIFDRDGRGAVTNRLSPIGRTQSFDYHLSGSASNFTDPTARNQRINDQLGRPTQIDYIADTHEREDTYEGARGAGRERTRTAGSSFRLR